MEDGDWDPHGDGEAAVDPVYALGSVRKVDEDILIALLHTTRRTVVEAVAGDCTADLTVGDDLLGISISLEYCVRLVKSHIADVRKLALGHGPRRTGRRAWHPFLVPLLGAVVVVCAGVKRAALQDCVGAADDAGVVKLDATVGSTGVGNATSNSVVRKPHRNLSTDTVARLLPSTSASLVKASLNGLLDVEAAGDPVETVRVGIEGIILHVLLRDNAIRIAAVLLRTELLGEDPLMRIPIAFDVGAAAARNAALTLDKGRRRGRPACPAWQPDLLALVAAVVIIDALVVHADVDRVRSTEDGGLVARLAGLVEA